MAGKLNVKRSVIFASCKKVAKALLNHPDNSISETGLQICRVFNKVQNPRKLNQSQSTGVILGIIESLENIDPANLETCGFKTWMDMLVNANEHQEQTNTPVDSSAVAGVKNAA